MGAAAALHEFAHLGLRYGKAREREELLEEMLEIVPGL